MHINEYSFRVRYVETDQMGIVYHSNYYVWFEMGRTEFMRTLGYTYRELENQDILLPILETHCVYKKPARYDDIITIKTTLSELKGLRIIFKYEAYNEKDQLLAQGSTVQASVNKDMQPISLKKMFPDVYDKLINATL